MRIQTTPLLLSLALLAPAASAQHQHMQMAQAEAPPQTEAPSSSTTDTLARIQILEAQMAAMQKELDELKKSAPAGTGAAEAPAAPEPASNEHGMPGMGGQGLTMGNVTVSGMLETQFTSAVGGSLKQPIFSNPKGNSDFILTHVHPMIHAQLSDKVSADVMWCLTHVGSTAVYEAYGEFAPSPGLDVKFGRWLLPFGAWNPISNPAQMKTISRPLMYLGHEERNIVLNGGPRPILNDEHSDIGLQLSGQKTAGRGLLNYAGYISNGFQDQFGDYPDSWIDFRPSEDNNSSKSLGGRLAYTIGGLTLGASMTGGKYDALNKYRYSIRGVDATWRGGMGLTVRAEYTDNPVDRSPGNGGNIHRHGWYLEGEKVLSPKWTLVTMYSTLTERPAANVERVSRFTLGADYKLADTTTLKTELGRLFLGRFVGDPANAPQGTDFQDVTTFKLSTVVSF